MIKRVIKSQILNDLNVLGEVTVLFCGHNLKLSLTYKFYCYDNIKHYSMYLNDFLCKRNNQRRLLSKGIIVDCIYFLQGECNGQI